MDKTGEDWNGLHLGKFEKRRPTFFQIFGMSVYTCNKISFNHSWKIILSTNTVVMWPWVYKWKTLGLPIWRLELKISKIQQNYIKQRDLAPLTAQTCTHLGLKGFTNVFSFRFSQSEKRLWTELSFKKYRPSDDQATWAKTASQLL